MASHAESLIHALRTVGDLDWYGLRDSPPKVIWRWREPEDEIGRALQHVAESYDGRVAWSVVRYHGKAGGTNWCLIPTEVIRTQGRESLASDAAAATWLKRHRPEWCREADDDLPAVVGLLREALGDAL